MATFYQKIIFVFLLFNSILFGQKNIETNYQTLKDVHNSLETIAKKHQGKTFEIGKSRGQLPLIVLQLGNDTNPAIMMTAGMDGNHPSGVQTLILTLNKLAENNQFQNLLKTKTIYVLAVGNPDAYNAYFNALKYEKRGNANKTDDARNGFVGDDPYNDLNKDGYITMMRIEDPTGDHIEHTDDSRIMTKADPNKNQRGKYLYFTEGLDDNKNGFFNEDASEGVNIDSNFAFDYQVFKKGTGEYAASEPETRAIMDFVMEQKNIHTVFNYGLQDNLIEPDKYDAKKAKDRIVKSWLEKDVKVVNQISDLYKKSTQIETSQKLNLNPGSFTQTMYYHAGRFSFTSPIWYPTVTKDSTDTKKLNHEQKFLKWADQEGLDNVYIPWKTIQHPDFPNKKVEIGGFIPYILWNPPIKYLEPLAERQKDFIISYLNILPYVEIVNPKVEKLDNNLYRVTVTTINNGFLPTSSEIGDKNRFVSKLKTEVSLNGNQKRVSGKKYYLNPPLEPNESVESSWIINGSGKITIQSGSATCGNTSITLELK